MDLYEFKANLVYIVSFRTVRAVTQRNLVSKTNKQTRSWGNVAGAASQWWGVCLECRRLH